MQLVEPPLIAVDSLRRMGKMGDTIREWREREGLSQPQLARKLGISQQAVQQLEAGKTQQPRYLVKLAKLIGCDPSALQDGKIKILREQRHNDDTVVEEKYFNREYREVPVYDVRAAAGDGARVDEENIKHKVVFRRDWLRGVTGAPLDKLAVLEANGDSMVPTISDGDHLLVDMTQSAARRDGIYVIRLDDELLVKRVTVDPMRRTVTISSDNPVYKPIESVPLTDVQVAGRVIWIGRRV